MASQRSTNSRDESPAVVFPASNTSKHGIHPGKDQKLHRSQELHLAFSAHTQVTNISVYIGKCLWQGLRHQGGWEEAKGTSWNGILAICSCICGTRTAEVSLVSRSARCLLKMPFKTPQSKWSPKNWESWQFEEDCDSFGWAPEPHKHIWVYILVRDVIFTAARDGKMKIKPWISKDTRGWKHGYKSRSPKKEAKLHKGSEGWSLAGPQADIRVQKFIIIVLQLISWGSWEVNHGCATDSYNPRVRDILQESW